MNPKHSQTAPNLNSYQQVGIYGSASEASPHHGIELMFDGAIQALSKAKGHIDRGEVSDQGEQIGRTLRILEGLVMSLDHEQGGEIAAGLLRLYDYMSRILLQANADNDAKLVDEAIGLFREISTAWSQIPAELRG